MQVKPFETIKDARVFALAGNAIITLQSNKTGNHFTYKVQAKKEEDPLVKSGAITRPDGHNPVWFVKVLSQGSADEGEWTYLGIITSRGFTTTKASKHMIDTPSVKAFNYFWTVQNLDQLTIRHEGRCGRCGRTLTHPESIDLGIGPECAGKIS